MFDISTPNPKIITFKTYSEAVAFRKKYKQKYGYTPGIFEAQGSLGVGGTPNPPPFFYIAKPAGIKPVKR